MKSIQVLAARLNPDSGHIEVVKDVEWDDGTKGLLLQVIHPDAFEWRAAEYGTDDLDEIIDILLHEPHVDSSDTLGQDAPKARQEHLQKIGTVKSSIVKAKASPTVAKAKLRTAGVAQEYIDAADTDPIVAIKAVCIFDPETVKVRRDYMAVARTSHARAKLAKAPIVSRADSVRAQLFREEMPGAASNKNRHQQATSRESSTIRKV
jgi:hypothetical protein